MEPNLRRIALAIVFFLTFSITTYPSSSNAALPAIPAVGVPNNTVPADTALNASQMIVSWTAVIGALGYVVTASSAGETTRTKTVTPGTASSVVMDQLTGGKNYSFVVASKNLDGESSAPAVLRTTLSVPDAPTVVSAVPGKGQITLSWSAPANTGGSNISSYVITASGVNETALATDTSIVINGLTSGAEYTFEIKAVNNTGASLARTFPKTTVPNVPGSPTGVTATVSGTTLTSTWVAPFNTGGSGITSYSAYLFSAAGTEIVASRKTSLQTTTTDFIDLPAGTYSVQITAVNLVGESTKSTASSQVIVSDRAANSPVFTPSIFPDLEIGSTILVSASAPSGGTITLAVSSSPAGACTLLSGLITAVVAGQCTLRATVGETPNYLSGSSTKIFNIVKKFQRISFATIPLQKYPGSYSLSATTSSSLPISYTVNGNCTIIGSQITFSSAGFCAVTALAPSNREYLEGYATQSFLISSSSGVPIGGGGGSITPTPTPTPTPSPTSSPTTSPTPTPSATTKVIKSVYFSIIQQKKNSKKYILRSTYSKIDIKIGTPLTVIIPGLSTNTQISAKISTPNKKSTQISVTKRISTTYVTLPTLVFKKIGKFTILVTSANKTKSLTIRVRK